jgi:hypothetical protein
VVEKTVPYRRNLLVKVRKKFECKDNKKPSMKRRTSDDFTVTERIKPAIITKEEQSGRKRVPCGESVLESSSAAMLAA